MKKRFLVVLVCAAMVMSDISGDIFINCTLLEKASVPGSMKYVVVYMFCDCTALTEVVIGEGIERIYENAFCNCTSLKSIDIPDSVTYIERNAFSGCKDIEINFKGKTYNEKNIEKIYDKDLSNL